MLDIRVFFCACFALLAASQGGAQTLAPESTKVTAQPSMIDTRKITPQIAPPRQPFFIRPENPLVFPWSPVGRTNSLKAGGVLSATRTLGATQFDGPVFSNAYPPDPDLAVGTNYIVATVNTVISYYRKSDGVRVFQQDIQTFFSGTGALTNFLFDPKVFYDPDSQRFFFVCLEEDDAKQDSALLFAVSSTSDPNGTWARYRFPVAAMASGVNNWVDYPGFGFNSDTVVICGNLFPFSGSGFHGAKIMVLPKAAVVAGSPVSLTSFLDPNAFGLQPCRTWDSSATAVYAPSYFNSTTLKIFAITKGGTATPAVTSTTLTIPSAIAPATDIAGPGNSTVDPLDGRILTSMFNGGTMVVSHAIWMSSVDHRVGSRWYEIAPNSWPTSGAPTLKQSGTVSGNLGENYHLPAVAKDQNGSIALLFNRSSNTIMADVMNAGRAASDPLGAMGSPSLIRTSPGVVGGNNGGRWGDFCGLTLDPTDRLTFWGLGEFIAGTNNWATTVAKFSIASTNVTPLDATAASVIVGSYISGAASDLKFQDGTSFVGLSSLNLGIGQVCSEQVVFAPTVAAATIKSLKLSASISGPAKGTGQVLIFNNTTNGYDQLATFSTASAATISATVSTGIAKYVNANGNVKLLFKVMQLSRYGKTAYQLKLDQCRLTQSS